MQTNQKTQLRHAPANAMLDALIAEMRLKNDAALARRLEVAPPVVSKLRHGALPVGASILISANEESGISIADLKALAGLPKGKSLIHSKGTGETQQIPETPLGYILLNLCNQLADQALYVAKYIAYVLRNPDVRMETALAFSGVQGSGKDLFFISLFSSLPIDIARNGMQMIRGIDLCNNFNNFFNEDTRLLTIDADHRLSNKELAHLKEYILNDNLEIRAKHKENRAIPNRLNFVLLGEAPNLNSHYFQEIRSFDPLPHPIPCGNPRHDYVFANWLLNDLDLTGFTTSSKFIPF